MPKSGLTIRGARLTLIGLEKVPRAMMEDAPLLLTLNLDPDSESLFESLRRRHFTPERNLIPAHLTLFHKLPPAKTLEIIDAVDEAAQRSAPLPLRASGLRFQGRA